MAVRKILLYPDPFLRRVAKPVTAFDKELANHIQDMIDTMRGLGHAIGVAATQVGVDRRILVMDASHKQPSGHGLMTLVNPVVAIHEGLTYTKEGCLSLPSFLGRVRRWTQVDVIAQTPEGSKKSWSLTGLEAICLQHELDHLNGILFIDRLNSLRSDLILRGKQKGKGQD